MKKVVIDIEKIEALAKLQFTKEEKEKLYEDLSEAVKLSEILLTLDSKEENPTTFAHLREDEAKNEGNPVLKNAPEEESGYFVVPEVLENE